MRRHLLLLSLLTACGPGQQAPPPVVDLAAAPDTLTLTDTDITDAVWLGGDRWALLAPTAKTVRIVDFGTKRVTVLGRPGRDYGEPFAIFRSGETLIVDDWGQRRATTWTLAGVMNGVLQAPTAFRGALPRGRDTLGWWYAELRPLGGPDGGGNRDSGSVVRWREGATADTVVRLAPYQMEQVTRDGATRYERQVLSGVDQWGVHPGGGVWVARFIQNLLQQCGSGEAGCSTGPQLPDRVLEVTLQDREYWLQTFPEEQRALARGVPFAIVKPPFDRAFATPGGEIWLQRSRALTDTTRSYQLLRADGTARLEARLPNRETVLGADPSHLLAIDPLIPGPGHRVLRYVTPVVVDSTAH